MILGPDGKPTKAGTTFDTPRWLRDEMIAQLMTMAAFSRTYGPSVILTDEWGYPKPQASTPGVGDTIHVRKPQRWAKALAKPEAKP